MDNSSTHQPLEYRSNVQRLAGTPPSQNIWGYSLMFGAEHFLCSSAQHEFLHQRIGSAISHFTLMQPRSAGAASVSSVRQPAQQIGAIHSSLAWRCDQCDSSVLPSPSPSCSSMPSMSSQSRGSSLPPRQSSSAPPPTALCHAQHHVSIGNTSGTMPSTHREPNANAARGKWGHNQRTLQWLHEQTIRMEFDSSRDNFILENDPVRRGYNVAFTLAIVIQRIHCVVRL
ncbi:regulator of sigma E protease [Trypanosoma cruzi]|nr:regulator of sigma E protease [Trypanosoma cruzi]